MAVVNFRTGGALALTASTLVFAFRQMGSESDVVVSTNSGPETNIDTSGPIPELVTQPETTTWEPAPLSTEVTESWDWDVNYTEEDKAKNREVAKKVLGTLEDYTFKFFLPCTVGTGWILDYQIAKEPHKYPTKWYIATASHVIQRLSFAENPYNQLLPKRDEWAKNKREKHQDYIDSISGANQIVRNNCQASHELGYFDMNISQEKTWDKGRRADIGGRANNQMKEPKLFYSAFRFIKDFEKAGGRNHFADFSILEIEFNDEKVARDATNNFADKYNVENKTEPIKFGRSIEERYPTKEQLWKAKDNYHILAYPVVPGKDAWKHTNNFDEKTTFASHLAGSGWDYEKANKPDKWRGFISAEKNSVLGTAYMSKFKWHGEEFDEFGHFYAFEHNGLDGGASGGLFVDSDGYGVGTLVQISGSMSLAMPLRSKGVSGDGFVTPAYDLILGAEGQNGSYREQVEEYIVRKGSGDTWLRKSGRLQVPNKSAS